jgi:Mg2+ and Co2+ transporter CorA
MNEDLSQIVAQQAERIVMLEQQMLTMSELLGNQSNLITTLSQQQVEASRSAAQITEMLGNIARLVEPTE